MQLNRAVALLLVMSSALIALSGCLPLVRAGQGPTPLPVTQEAAQRLEDKLYAAMKQSLVSDFTLEATQEEVTSYLALKLPDMPFLQPQVRFAPDRVIFTGNMTQPIAAPVHVAGSAQAQDGKVTVVLQEAKLGFLSVPGFVLQSISDTMNELLAESQGAIQISRLQILEGKVIVSGRIKRS
ncbi:MAG: hypothetical protein AB1566_03670 [Chloroflexota bacterium]